VHLRMPLSPKERHSKVIATWVPFIFLRIHLLFCLWFGFVLIFLFFVLIFMLVIEELVFWILGFVLYRWWSLVLAMLNAYLCEVLFLMAICSEIWAQLSRILSLVWSWELKLKWEVRDHCLNFVWKVKMWVGG
jgi:hypothetical protein